MSTPSETLQARARSLLESGEAHLVIGHGAGTNPQKTTPVFITRAEDVGQLVLNPFCVNNLANWLTRKDLRARFQRIAVVAKEPDIRAVVVLIQEEQVKADAVRVIGVRIDRPGDPASPCEVLPQTTLEDLQKHLRESFQSRDLTPDQLAAVEALEAKPPAERWAFWRQQLDKCIRCHACRQACPMCYCDQCIATLNQPQWIDTSSHPQGNMAWNIARAFHLAGRCINCGECERSCPVNIPLMLLNRFLARQVKAHFGYLAGYNTEEYQPFATYKCEDSEDFIL
ncbi:MAG TPA: 4Fe-4S dicluster domain-containing protein [Planctomycetota bacterium]|nr:4Fe-4S dicluster domain-containing protein [Planctomycetota bacterium]HRR80410.1 4Fe-4S dicluster domain-containing protein [Planctomycetota bacterium]HRT96050.1 4Fe-4S dicluster domain-containing protein [Planctomycetota bacterium]